MEAKVGLHNEFDIIVRDAKTGKIKQEAKAYNIILNQFWEYLMSGFGDNLSYLHVGSGTTTPTASDTALTTPLVARSATLVSTDYSDFDSSGVVKVKKSIRLEDTEFVGDTIGEVGFGRSSVLHTKALLKDTNGNAITIVKGTGEVIDVFGTFYIKFYTAGSEMTWDTIRKGDTFTRMINAGGWTDTGATLWTNKSMCKSLLRNNQGGDCPYYSLTSTKSADVPNKKLTYSFSNITAGNGNIGGFGHISWGGLEIKLPRTGFTQPVLTKEVIGTGDGSNTKFTPAFGYILDNSTAKVYVNDVEVSATISYGVPVLKDKYFHPYCNIISQTIKADGTIDYTKDIIFENPYYLVHPINKMYGESANVYASQNGTDWDYLMSMGDYADMGAYKNYRYWKLELKTIGQNIKPTRVECIDYTTTNKIITLDSAPADGATVALTYQPNCIAKDANHVVNNMSIVLSFNEYTPT